MHQDSYWMQRCLQLAKKASALGEVPVGACIVVGDQCIADGFNQPITTNNPCGHAEVIALMAAGQKLQNYRLTKATIFVTLEPCLMCFGAMVHARVARLVYSTKDNKVGLFSSGELDLLVGRLNHTMQISSGILAKESELLLKNFFKEKRKK